MTHFTDTHASKASIKPVSGEVGLPITITAPRFVHFGNVTIPSAFPDDQHNAIASVVASHSSVPRDLAVWDARSDAEQDPFPEHEIDIDEASLPMRGVLKARVDVTEFGKSQQLLLKKLIITAYIHCTRADTGNEAFVYVSLLGTKFLPFIKALEDAKDTDAQIAIVDYGKVLMAAEGEAGSIRSYFSLMYNFGEHTTNVTIVDDPK